MKIEMNYRNGIGAEHDATGADAVACVVFTDDAVPGDERLNRVAVGRRLRRAQQPLAWSHACGQI